MGRGKLNMELITKEKPRMITYEKRKKGLLKKAEEFSILCDVKTCVIIFGPKSKNKQFTELVTFPEDANEVRNIINKFNCKASSDFSRRKRSNNLSDFFVLRKNKIVDEISRLRKANLEARFPSWDDCFNDFSLEQLRALDATFESKLQVAKRKLVMMKSEQQVLLQDCTKQGNTLVASSSQFNYNHNTANYMDLEAYNNHQQPIPPSMKLLDNQLPTYYSANQPLQMVLFDLNPAVSVPMTTPAIINKDEYSQVYGDHNLGMCIPSNNIMQNLPGCYDPTTAAMLESVVHNPRSLPMCYYAPNMQQQMPYYGHQTMPNASSSCSSSSLLIAPHQFHEYFHDMNDQIQKT